MRETGATKGAPPDPVEAPTGDSDAAAGATTSPDHEAAAGKGNAPADAGGPPGGSASSAAARGAGAASSMGPGAGTSASPGPGAFTSASPGFDAGRAADPSGRAPRPALPPTAGSTGSTGGVPGGSVRPSFTRAPGMPPPPETIDGAERPGRPDSAVSIPAVLGVPSSPALTGPPRADTSSSGSFPVVSASVPVSAPPRATGRVSAAGAFAPAPPEAPAPDTATGGVTIRPIGPGTAVGAARVGQPVRVPRTATTPRGPRRARLTLKRIDPWSVMKFSFAVSLVLFIVVIVAASVLYLALDSMGVFTSINETVADLVESGGGEGVSFQITARGVIGTAAVLGALNVLLFTSLATLAAFIYNVCADLVGGVEVMLAERD